MGGDAASVESVAVVVVAGAPVRVATGASSPHATRPIAATTANVAVATRRIRIRFVNIQWCRLTRERNLSSTLRQVLKRSGDKRVMGLVKAFLKAGILSEDGVERAADLQAVQAVVDRAPQTGTRHVRPMAVGSRAL